MRFVVTSLAARGHDVTLLDALELRLPLLDKMYKEYPKGGAPEPLETMADLQPRELRPVQHVAERTLDLHVSAHGQAADAGVQTRMGERS
jgi:hypothetical protein